MVPLTVPEIDSDVGLLADWLELRALFSLDGRAKIRELAAQEDLDWDQDEDAIDEADARLEDLATRLAAQISSRRTALPDAYPYTLSADGYDLQLLPDTSWNVGHTTYLFSLLLAHASSSDIVSGAVRPIKTALVAARDLFQICGTLAAAAHVQGPAFCFGFPRADASGFVAKIKEIWAKFKDGTPRDAPLSGSGSAKDDGVDVVAWRPQPDGKPSTLYILAQVASGNNWDDKSIKPYIDLFHEEWFSVVPAADASPAIMIPFLLNTDEMRRAGRKHGLVLHRERLPQLAGDAVALAGRGVTPIERLGETEKLRQWILAHRDRVLAATST
jgi:hypothetical protein